MTDNIAADGNGKVALAITNERLLAALERLQDHERRVRELEQEVSVLRQRVGMFATINAVASIALSVAAGIFGSRP